MLIFFNFCRNINFYLGTFTERATQLLFCMTLDLRSAGIHAVMPPRVNSRREQSATLAPVVKQTVGSSPTVLGVGGPMMSVTYQSTALETL